MKSETRSKIIGLMVFIVLISWIFYMSFASNWKNHSDQIKTINITGNTMLSENDYLVFARLDSSDSYKNITLPIIKSRMEKHPYIRKAEVEFSGKGEVYINLIEKNIKAVVVNNNELFLATNEFEILRFLPNTKVTNVPVITNPSNDDFIKNNEVLKTPGLVQAFKIIDAENLSDENISKKLSEINLRNGGDILLSFTGIKPPVIFGRGNTAEKLLSFNQLINEKNAQNELAMNSTYIDLRFENEIFLGNSDKTGSTE
jgi:cell division septal protein FtsQ